MADDVNVVYGEINYHVGLRFECREATDALADNRCYLADFVAIYQLFYCADERVVVFDMSDSKNEVFPLGECDELSCFIYRASNRFFEQAMYAPFP